MISIFLKKGSITAFMKKWAPTPHLLRPEEDTYFSVWAPECQRSEPDRGF
jgi:hypothetical protein